MRVSGFSALGLVLCLVIGAAGEARSADPVAVRYGSIGGTPDAALFIADELGFYRDEGFQFKYQRLDNAAALLGAIATDQLDVSRISLTPGLFASIQQGINLRVVGDGQSILRNFAATQFVVRSDLADGSEAEIFQRLRGKAIAISGKTSAGGFLLGVLLKKYGMSFADVRVIEMGYPSMLPAFTNQAIDAAVVLEPFLSQQLAAKAVKSVSDLVELTSGEGASIVPLVYSEKFAADQARGEAFMRAYIRGVRAYSAAILKGTDKDKIIEIVARRTNTDPAIILASNPVGYAPTQQLNLEFLQQAQQYYLDQRYLQTPVDLKKLVDPSFAQAAVRALGEPK